MKFKFVLGLILIIIAITALVAILPSVLSFTKSININPGSFFNLPKAGNYSSGTGNGSRNELTPDIKTGESIYKGRLSISSVSRYSNGQVSLKASYSNENILNITGWRIKSLQRGETIIGKGYALPQFDANGSDVQLVKGEPADIIVGPSPLWGNFRINDCFGWLSGIYNIGYSMNYCPSISYRDLTGLDGPCQEAILRAGTCKAPSADTLNRQTSQCRQWAEQNLTYNSCVVKNIKNDDFYKGWKIYTGNYNQIYDPLHDKIEIRDQAGLLVDEYSY